MSNTKSFSYKTSMKGLRILKLIFLLSTFYFLFSANGAFAAEVRVDSKSHNIKVGEQFEASFFLNTGEEFINAVEGRVVFSVDLLEVREIRDGNSIINFWIERPYISQLGAIVFSGITPGGFLGPKEHLFSIVFYAKQSGSGTIQTDTMRVLRNDGEGTEAPVKISPFQFFIFPKGPTTQPIVEPMRDTSPPEAFRPEIVQNPDMFNGQWFIVFATQDKGSGIDRYEVCEGSKRKCVIAESPYLLQNQELDKKVFVKAIDKSGNERIEVLYPLHWRPPWYENYWIFGILIAGSILVLYIVIVRKILWQKFIK